MEKYDAVYTGPANTVDNNRISYLWYYDQYSQTLEVKGTQYNAGDKIRIKVNWWRFNNALADVSILYYTDMDV